MRITFLSVKIRDFVMINDNHKIEGSDVRIESNADINVDGCQVPTLDQFMALITDEQKSVVSSPSGYNVYNKYHKTS